MRRRLLVAGVVLMFLLPGGVAAQIGSPTCRLDSITRVEQPKKSRVEVSGTAIRYTPASGFEGNDAFLVAWFGRGTSLTDPGANFRTRVTVEVRAK